MSESRAPNTSPRQPLPEKLARQVKAEFASFASTDMSSYTYEHWHSNFYDAKEDLAVYDGSGNLVLRGRNFGHRTFFWQD